MVLWAASTMGQGNAGWTPGLGSGPSFFVRAVAIGGGVNLSSQRHQTKTQNIKSMPFSDGVASLNRVRVNGVGGTSILST